MFLRDKTGHAEGVHDFLWIAFAVVRDSGFMLRPFGANEIRNWFPLILEQMKRSRAYEIRDLSFVVSEVNDSVRGIKPLSDYLRDQAIWALEADFDGVHPFYSPQRRGYEFGNIS
jgi:hypothetical protein